MTSLDEHEIIRAAHEQRKRGAILLGRVDSRSEKGHKHSIMLGSDNLVYCTCKGWEIRHTCYHLDTFKEALRRKL